jgi:saccharopepsin
MQLKKLPTTSSSLMPNSDLRPSPQMEAEFLKHKHLGLLHEDSINGQKPLGLGRKVKGHKKWDDDDKDLFWAMMQDDQEGGMEKRMVKGGHGVPLSGKCRHLLLSRGHTSIC